MSSNQLPTTKLRSYVYIGVGVLLIIVGLVLFAVLETQNALSQAKLLNFDSAQTHTKRAAPIVTVLSLLTLQQQADIEVWKNGLKLLDEIAHLKLEAHAIAAAYTHQSDQPTDLRPLSYQLASIAASLSKLEQLLPKTTFVQHQVQPDNIDQLSTGTAYFSIAAALIDHLTESNQTWVILFQNSNELRATGGFTGSYAVFMMHQGIAQPLIIEDIYDADGQFVGYVSPPPGVHEYTSGNRGLRLPDANWWPDFPKSAQTQLQFFELGNKDPIAGVVAINISVLEELLAITGPIFLPDYDLELTAQNAADVLRTDRESFFPGSSQKKDLISHATTMLSQKITSLNQEQVRGMLGLLISLIPEKSIQAYATDPQIQNHLAELGITGELGTNTVRANTLQQACQCELESFMLVESNVGINKVNEAVTRSVSLDWQANTLATEIVFNHDGSYTPKTAGENAGYLNYQRLIFSPEYTISSITVNDRPIPRYDLSTITTHQGQDLQQLGFIIPIPSNTTQRATITLQRNTPYTQKAGLLIHKQSGLPITPYSIETPAGEQVVHLKTDTVIQQSP
ncbi:MAG: DUF4012 domain-containing protein [Patescibacteria group bacterium]